MTMSMSAQRIAVIEFSAGVGVSNADVDGLSSIFTTYFHPANYTLVERTEIDRVIDEQQIQRSSMTESQMVKIGRILNLSKIVIGKINIIAGEYNVDVRVVNVETGTIVVTDGSSFTIGSYRNNMKALAENLALKLADVSASGQPQPVKLKSLPQSMVSKFKKYPETFDVAVGYNEQLYFISEDSLRELLSYDRDLYMLLAVMITGGENALGVGRVNSIDECDIKTAQSFLGLLPDERAYGAIMQNIDHINDLIRTIGGQPMQSKYWTVAKNSGFMGMMDVQSRSFQVAGTQNLYFKGQKFLIRLVWPVGELRQFMAHQ